MTSQLLASGGLIDWEALTGQSKVVIDLVSIPVFSAFAGIITNWTGVLMLFAPVRFHGFYCPGIAAIYPYLPRRVQILPIFAPGSVLGFQGFIPARVEKMASICVDKGLGRVGSMKDFFDKLDPDGLAAYMTKIALNDIRPMVDQIMEREHPELWAQLPPAGREIVYQRVEQNTPAIIDKIMTALRENIDVLVDIKLLTVGHLRKNPQVMKDIIYNLGAPELRFMVRIGFILGAPLGLLLALLLQVHHLVPVLNWLPAWLLVLAGASVIGIIVNIVAIRVVFTPADPKPRYRCLWKQAKFAKRQHVAAAAFGHSMAFDMLTLPNIANEVLHGASSDRTRLILETILLPEIDAAVGPIRPLVRMAIGGNEYDRIRASSSAAVLTIVPTLAGDKKFARKQGKRVAKFATKRLRALPPSEFMDMLYSAIEQDAWLLYLHGGLLGIVVGGLHLILFGA